MTQLTVALAAHLRDRFAARAGSAGKVVMTPSARSTPRSPTRRSHRRKATRVGRRGPGGNGSAAPPLGRRGDHCTGRASRRLPEHPRTGRRGADQARLRPQRRSTAGCKRRYDADGVSPRSARSRIESGAELNSAGCLLTVDHPESKMGHRTAFDHLGPLQFEVIGREPVEHSHAVT